MNSLSAIDALLAYKEQKGPKNQFPRLVAHGDGFTVIHRENFAFLTTTEKKTNSLKLAKALEIETGAIGLHAEGKLLKSGEAVKVKEKSAETYQAVLIKSSELDQAAPEVLPYRKSLMETGEYVPNIQVKNLSSGPSKVMSKEKFENKYLSSGLIDEIKQAVDSNDKTVIRKTAQKVRQLINALNEFMGNKQPKDAATRQKLHKNKAFLVSQEGLLIASLQTTKLEKKELVADFRNRLANFIKFSFEKKYPNALHQFETTPSLHLVLADLTPKKNAFLPPISSFSALLDHMVKNYARPEELVADLRALDSCLQQNEIELNPSAEDSDPLCIDTNGEIIALVDPSGEVMGQTFNFERATFALDPSNRSKDGFADRREALLETLTDRAITLKEEQLSRSGSQSPVSSSSSAFSLSPRESSNSSPISEAASLDSILDTSTLTRSELAQLEFQAERGSLIRQTRENAGLSEEDFALQIGLLLEVEDDYEKSKEEALEVVSQIESGLIPLEESEIAEMTKALGCSSRDLEPAYPY